MAGNAGWFAGAICKYANVKMWKCFARRRETKGGENTLIEVLSGTNRASSLFRQPGYNRGERNGTQRSAKSFGSRYLSGKQ
jgi:hypothetical protein